MTRRLLLLRHARTATNASGRYVSRSDPDLDEVGRRDAAALAAALADVPVVGVLSSPAARARQTAAIVAAAQRPPLEVQVDERLRELDLGPFEGRSSVELRRGAAAADYAGWRSVDAHRTPAGVEPLADVAARCAALVASLEGDGTRLLVTHAFTSRILLATLLGLPLPHHRMLKLDLCHLAVLEREDGFWRMTHMNVAQPAALAAVAP